MWFGLIFLAGCVALVGLGFWWSGRGLTDSDRAKLDQDFKKADGWGAGGLGGG